MTTHENCSTNLTVYSDYFILTRDPLHRGSYKDVKKDQMLANRSTKYNGFMSPATERKVRTILTAWVSAVDAYKDSKTTVVGLKHRKLTFVTLTLSSVQVHTDKEVKRKMLNSFLIKVQRKCDVKYYFWRAEKQKNGNIHFHVILDSYIDKRIIQQYWNEIQNTHGYIDMFFATHGHVNPPSTQVRVIDGMANSIGYILKYVSKNPENIDDESLKVGGRIWSCSKELKSLKPYSSSEDKVVISRLNHEAKLGNVEVLDADFFTIYRCNTRDFFRKHFSLKMFEVQSYYRGIYKELYSNSLPIPLVVETLSEPVTKIAWVPKQLKVSFYDEIPTTIDVYLDNH